MLALEGEFDVLLAAAVRRLSDPAALEQAALRASDREVLKILLAKLEDKSMLNRIAAAADDRAMRLAAAQKNGTRSWKKIFDAANAKGATVQMLGDALAVASFFPKVQPEAVSGVQHACLNLIRRGNESRIPEMVDLFDDYGDKTLAEDYLNCGQPDLDAEAREWARWRRYNISPGSRLPPRHLGKQQMNKRIGKPNHRVHATAYPPRVTRDVVAAIIVHFELWNKKRGLTIQVHAFLFGSMTTLKKMPFPG